MCGEGRPADRGGAGDHAAESDELPVHALSTAEALLVWGIRHWVSCLKAGTDPIPLMVAGFGSGGIARAVRPLESILVITLDAATSPRDVRCTKCATVGDGERDLLAAVAFEQAGRPVDTLLKLRDWLPPASARLAKELVAEIAGVMRDHELKVSLRREYDAGSGERTHPDLRVAVPASLSVH